ncbi:right-handed parallel beta-helix repeat-containing protein [bacterium]|nr:right-handed parallel beta-helix repeat-containing protein [bacterium]
MRALPCAVLAALLLLSVSSTARTITVDCNGGGDYTDLQYGVAAAGPDDIVLVFPCTYTVGPGWPIYLDSESPRIMSIGGPEVTIIEGDGTRSAFRHSGGHELARIHIRGFTFRNVSKVLQKGMDDEGVMVFRDNVIENCGHGLDARWMWWGSYIGGNLITGNSGNGIDMYHCWAVIEDNEICFNTGTGMAGVCCEEPQIRRNHIHHNTGCGISTGFYADITHNIIEHNGGTGIGTNSVSGNNVVEHNIIRHNAGGIALYMYASLTFRYNDVYGNSGHNVVCEWYTSGAEFDATMNWWGTTDPEEIAAGIHDCHDDPQIETCVIFDPWCSCPGCEPTSANVRSWGAIKSLFR